MIPPLVMVGVVGLPVDLNTACMVIAQLSKSSLTLTWRFSIQRLGFGFYAGHTTDLCPVIASRGALALAENNS